MLTMISRASLLYISLLLHVITLYVLMISVALRGAPGGYLNQCQINTDPQMEVLYVNLNFAGYLAKDTRIL